MRRARTEVVIVGFDATAGASTDALLDLVHVLQRVGCAPRILLVGDGERLRDLRRSAPVTVINHFRWRGLAIVPSLLRQDEISRALKGRRLRRWMRRRSGLPWIIQDPAAASVLRFGSPPPQAIGVCLPPGTAIAELPEPQRALLADATVWLGGDRSQLTDIEALEPREIILLDELDLADAHDVVERGDPSTWPVLLVPTPGAWEEINHTDEVAAHLATAHPDVRTLWLVSGPEDRWLAEHDLEARGLTRTVELVTHEEVEHRPLRALVRTGYGPAHQDLLRQTRARGLTTISLGSGEEPGDLRVPPLAIDELLRTLDHALSDVATAEVLRGRVVAQREARDRAMARRDALLLALTGRTTGDGA
jgi:hypothetical protein